MTAWQLRYAAILDGRSNNEEAMLSERAPSIRVYRDSLTAKNRKANDQKLNFNSGIEPYPVSASFFSQSMDKWPEIEFPDVVFSSIKFTREQLKGFKSLQSYQCFVAGWARSILVTFLPELLAKWYTKPRESASVTQ